MLAPKMRFQLPATLQNGFSPSAPYSSGMAVCSVSEKCVCFE